MRGRVLAEHIPCPRLGGGGLAVFGTWVTLTVEKGSASHNEARLAQEGNTVPGKLPGLIRKNALEFGHRFPRR